MGKILKFSYFIIMRSRYNISLLFCILLLTGQKKVESLPALKENSGKTGKPCWKKLLSHVEVESYGELLKSNLNGLQEN